MKPETMMIDDVKYVRADKVGLQNEKDGLPCVCVRSRDAGVFVGYLKSRYGTEVELLEARRIWYWDGAASLSQLANEGTKKPNECKFPAEVPTATILGVCEILPVSDAAKASIDSVKVWAK